MPDYLFLDRDGNSIGIIRSDERDWEVGAIVERPSGLYRVLEVVVPLFEDVEGMRAYVIVQAV